MRYNSKLHGRRLKYIFVDPQIIVEILYNFSKYQEGTLNLPIIQGLPENCQVVGVNYDFMMQGFVLVLQNDIFEEVPEGEMTPRLGYHGIGFQSVKVMKDWKSNPHMKELFEQEFYNCDLTQEQKVKESHKVNPFQKYKDLV